MSIMSLQGRRTAMHTRNYVDNLLVRALRCEVIFPRTTKY